MRQQATFGKGSIQQLRDILTQEHAKRILLVCGKDSFRTSGAEGVLMPLLKGAETVRFSEFAQNPKIEDIQCGIDLARAFNPDIVLAVGGGSVLDMGKLINLLAHQEGDLGALIRGEAPLHPSRTPLVAVPTTSGTGSEATHFAVAYIGHAKYSVAHAAALPPYALIDPDLTMRMPPRLTAITGLDALCQAIESYWAVGATDESRAYAEEAIALIMASLHRAVNAPTVESRRDMAYGAHLAGKAINISKTTAPHALSYTLTSYYGVPHGHAVALTLGKCILANARAASDQILHPSGAQFQSTIMRRLYNAFGASSPEDCDKRWQELVASIGLESRIAEVGISSPHDLERIVSKVNLERLSNHPVRLSAKALYEVLAI